LPFDLCASAWCAESGDGQTLAAMLSSISPCTLSGAQGWTSFINLQTLALLIEWRLATDFRQCGGAEATPSADAGIRRPIWVFADSVQRDCEADEISQDRSTGQLHEHGKLAHVSSSH